MGREFNIIRGLPLRAIALGVCQCRKTGTDRGWIERYSEKLESDSWDFERDDSDASPPVVVGPIRYPERGFFPEYAREEQLPSTRFGTIAFVGDVAYVGSACGRWIKLPQEEEYFLLPDGNHRISAAILLRMETYPVVRQLRGSYVEALDYASGPANSGSRFLFYAPEKGSGLAKVLCKFENPELREIWWRRPDTEIAAECGVSPPIVKVGRDRFLSNQTPEEQKRLTNLAAVKIRGDGSEVRTDFRGRKPQSQKTAPAVHSPAPFVSPPVPMIRLNPAKNYQQPPSPSVAPNPKESSSYRETPESGRVAREVRSVLEEFNLKNVGELRDRLSEFDKIQAELNQSLSELQACWDEIEKLKRTNQSMRLVG